MLASLPAQQTVFEYLVGCWKRLNSARAAVLKKVQISCAIDIILLQTLSRDTTQSRHSRLWVS